MLCKINVFLILRQLKLLSKFFEDPLWNSSFAIKLHASMLSVLLKVKLLHKDFSKILSTVSENLFQGTFFHGCFHDLFLHNIVLVFIDFFFVLLISLKPWVTILCLYTKYFSETNLNDLKQQVQLSRWNEDFCCVSRSKKYYF